MDDGHQVRTSLTTTTLSNSDVPGHGYFINVTDSPFDWRSPQNNNLWQGVNGINNLCPEGFRLPTDAEWNAERLSWSSYDAAGAFASPLKLPMAGFRGFFDGQVFDEGSNGLYWSSTVSNVDAWIIRIYSADSYLLDESRAHGMSVRCIKD